MGRKRHTIHKKYSNCKIYHPSGKLMCVNSEKKGRWYVEKTGAKVLETNSDGSLKAIQLTFEPKGHGYEEDDVFGLSIQETKCVVTGETSIKKLTKHHIVPISYRRHLPLEYKSRNHHDVVYMTEDAHDEYERIADKFRDELAKQYGAMTYSEATEHLSNALATDEVRYLRKIKGYALAIYSNNSLPADRYREMYGELKSYLEKFYDARTEQVTSYWLEKIVNDIQDEIDRITELNKVDPYKDLIDKVGDYDKFVKIWRTHFIETMKPKYMPKGWSIDYRTKVEI